MSTCCTFWVAVVCVALTVTARLIDGFAMPALSEADMRAMVERSKREQPGHCQLHPFNVSVAVEDGMCVGSVPAFGCVGRCETSEAPHYYMSRHEANIPDPWTLTEMGGHLLLLALAAASTALWLVQGQSGEMEGLMMLNPDLVEAGSVVDPNATVPSSNGFCSLYPHQLTLSFRGCETTYETLSCTGRCLSTEEPNHFYSRPDASVEAYIGVCNCCSATGWGVAPRILDLDCPDNSTLTVLHFTIVVTQCSCAACF